MSYMKPYWIGSNVPYEEYLRRRDIAREGAKPVVAAISEQTKAIVGELQTVNRNLEQIDRTLQWGFAETIKQLRFMNETLSELLKAVKNPAQTAAFEQFEIARDAYRRGLYPEALAAITAAIDGNNASPGYKLEWRFHFFLGFLRLGNFDNTSPEVVDLAKAEAAFLEAARIARADTPDEAARALTAAGWAALVASGGSGEALERAHTHTLNARRTWEGIVDEGTVATGRADTYAQLAKVAAVRGDDVLLGEAFQTAIVLDYGKLAAAVEDGDLAARTATDAAVSAAIDRQTSWLQKETQRRLEVARRANFDTSVADIWATPVRLAASPGLRDVVRFVACGPVAGASTDYESLWTQIIDQTCLRAITTQYNGALEALSWSHIEAIAQSGACRLYSRSRLLSLDVIGAAPIVGHNSSLKFTFFIIPYHHPFGFVDPFDVPEKWAVSIDLITQIESRRLHLSDGIISTVWQAGAAVRVRTFLNRSTGHFGGAPPLPTGHSRAGVLFLDGHRGLLDRCQGAHRLIATHWYADLPTGKMPFNHQADEVADSCVPVRDSEIYAITILRPNPEDFASLKRDSVVLQVPCYESKIEAIISSTKTLTAVNNSRSAAQKSESRQGADMSINTSNNSSPAAQSTDTGLLAISHRMLQKAEASKRDADAALAKARLAGRDNEGGKPLDTTAKLLLMAVFVLLAAATIAGALK